MAALGLISVGKTVVIVIGVRVVADSVAIGVGCLGGVQWEQITAVLDSVVVVIGVRVVADSVAIGVHGLRGVVWHLIDRVVCTISVYVIVL